MHASASLIGRGVLACGSTPQARPFRFDLFCLVLSLPVCGHRLFWLSFVASFLVSASLGPSAPSLACRGGSIDGQTTGWGGGDAWRVWRGVFCFCFRFEQVVFFCILRGAVCVCLTRLRSCGSESRDVQARVSTVGFRTRVCRGAAGRMLVILRGGQGRAGRSVRQRWYCTLLGTLASRSDRSPSYAEDRLLNTVTARRLTV